MSKTYEQIYMEGIESLKESNAQLAEIERSRITDYLKLRIEHHYGCRGLVSTCEQCIVLRQVISFVNKED